VPQLHSVSGGALTTCLLHTVARSENIFLNQHVMMKVVPKSHEFRCYFVLLSFY
jgi:hypothetical protein